jgi:hypothetical protein
MDWLESCSASGIGGFDIGVAMRGTSRQTEISGRQAEISARSERFGALSEAERHVLRRWLSAAHAVGIDTVDDLTARHWPAVLSAAVIGVFLFGEQSAAWLAVGQEGSWAVASCTDGSISPPVSSLADALAIVYSAREAASCS